MYWRAVDRDSSIPNTTTCESPSSSTSLELSTTTALMSPAGRPAAATAAGSGRTEHQVCGHRGHGHSGQARPVPREGGGSTLRPPFFGELTRAELAKFLGVGHVGFDRVHALGAEFGRDHGGRARRSIPGGRLKIGPQRPDPASKSCATTVAVAASASAAIRSPADSSSEIRRAYSRPMSPLRSLKRASGERIQVAPDLRASLSFAAALLQILGERRVLGQRALGGVACDAPGQRLDQRAETASLVQFGRQLACRGPTASSRSARTIRSPRRSARRPSRARRG